MIAHLVPLIFTDENTFSLLGNRRSLMGRLFFFIFYHGRLFSHFSWNNANDAKFWAKM